MRSQPAWALAGLVLPLAVLSASPSYAALPPWGQRVAELHAALDAGARALAGSGEVIVTVTYDQPHYMVETENCIVLVRLAAPELLADEAAISVPGSRQFSAYADSPVCD